MVKELSVKTDEAVVVLHSGHKHNFKRDKKRDVGKLKHYICACGVGQLRNDFKDKKNI